jgi:cell division protein FtsB
MLEEREKLQARLTEAEEGVERLSHDQAILLEEVQSQQDTIASLTAEKEALQAEMEDTEVS